MSDDETDHLLSFTSDNFKSCYARSMLVSSESKPTNHNSRRIERTCSEKFKAKTSSNYPLASYPLAYQPKMNHQSSRTVVDISKRLSSYDLSHTKTKNFAEVENIYSENKIETLKWQLGEVEKSRGMYRALMKQVVTFLEKAHINLGHLGNRLQANNSVCRSKSEHHLDSECESRKPDKIWTATNKKEGDLYSEQVAPEKLAQEAFRLLRTAQSLLSTQEPNLQSRENHADDMEFLEKLATEFGKDSNVRFSPKLILPERRHVPRSNIRSESDLLPFEVARCEILQEKPASAMSVVSSLESESGFSSLNSFQDVGLPLGNSTGITEISTRNCLLKSMLHDPDPDPGDSALKIKQNSQAVSGRRYSLSDIKLWEKPAEAFKKKDDHLDIFHKRAHSSLAKNNKGATISNPKVLWV